VTGKQNRTQKEQEMAGITPLGDRVLVKRSEAADKTPGGIQIPESAKEKTTKGTVIAIGEGRLLDDGSVRPLTVKPEDTVMFGKFIGTEVQLEGAEYLMMHEDEILGIIT
jgi:chaperonin GroES